jgi:hypothetical protein
MRGSVDVGSEAYGVFIRGALSSPDNFSPLGIRVPRKKRPKVDLGRRLLKLRALLALPGALPPAGEFYAG